VTATVTTTVGVIRSIHHYTADGGTNALAAFAASGADLDVLVLDIADGANGSLGGDWDFANFARRQLDRSKGLVLGHELGSGASGADDLSAPTGGKLDTVDLATDWDARDGETVASLDRSGSTGINN
jgi:hypothetical protein